MTLTHAYLLHHTVYISVLFSNKYTILHEFAINNSLTQWRHSTDIISWHPLHDKPWLSNSGYNDLIPFILFSYYIIKQFYKTIVCSIIFKVSACLPLYIRACQESSHIHRLHQSPRTSARKTVLYKYGFSWPAVNQEAKVHLYAIAK